MVVFHSYPAEQVLHIPSGHDSQFGSSQGIKVILKELKISPPGYVVLIEKESETTLLLVGFCIPICDLSQSIVTHDGA